MCLEKHPHLHKEASARICLDQASYQPSQETLTPAAPSRRSQPPDFVSTGKPQKTAPRDPHPTLLGDIWGRAGEGLPEMRAGVILQRWVYSCGCGGNWKKVSATRSSHPIPLPNGDPRRSWGPFKPGRECLGNRFALGETEARRVKESKCPNSSASHSFCLLNSHCGTCCHPLLPFQTGSNPLACCQIP